MQTQCNHSKNSVSEPRLSCSAGKAAMTTNAAHARKHAHSTPAGTRTKPHALSIPRPCHFQNPHNHAPSKNNSHSTTGEHKSRPTAAFSELSTHRVPFAVAARGGTAHKGTAAHSGAAVQHHTHANMHIIIARLFETKFGHTHSHTPSLHSHHSCATVDDKTHNPEPQEPQQAAACTAAQTAGRHLRQAIKERRRHSPS